MRAFNNDHFLQTFQNYFDLSVETGRTKSYYNEKSLTIYYSVENYLNSDDPRIMVMDFKYTENVEDLSLSVRISLDNNFKKTNGMLINSNIIKENIEKAKAYLPVFKKITSASYNGKPHLNIKCHVKQLKDENGNVTFEISDVTYGFEISFNVQKNGQSNNCNDFISYVDKNLEKYFEGNNLDIQDTDYKRKLELYSMMEI